ncbi:hypothetical protein Pla175_46500 [Pirellulimonas nuda]|uniref:Uncharacterized protein n=1 Tax=Pirellulimonas nuda TaxID=2528009 RepID=A0A518DIB8_9BACT|nr:hypothetical protein [Pirellulimonas nuda]QDU91230.1 hypothetical protein Pla175_46500 [Pirellulimonas nuda]
MARKPILVVLVIVAVCVAALIAWRASSPVWQMSARNSPNGVVVEVYKSGAAQPTYATVLTGKTIGADVDRATRQNLPAALATTVFYDDTMRPGRWTVAISGTTLDIMEHALIINGATQLTPLE